MRGFKLLWGMTPVLVVVAALSPCFVAGRGGGGHGGGGHGGGGHGGGGFRGGYGGGGFRGGYVGGGVRGMRYAPAVGRQFAAPRASVARSVVRAPRAAISVPRAAVSVPRASAGTIARSGVGTANMGRGNFGGAGSLPRGNVGAGNLTRGNVGAGNLTRGNVGGSANHVAPARGTVVLNYSYNGYYYGNSWGYFPYLPWGFYPGLYGGYGLGYGLGYGSGYASPCYGPYFNPAYAGDFANGQYPYPALYPDAYSGEANYPNPPNGEMSVLVILNNQEVTAYWDKFQGGYWVHDPKVGYVQVIPES